MRGTNHWPEIAQRSFNSFDSFASTVIGRLSGRCQKWWCTVRKVCLVWTKHVRLLILKQAGSSDGIRLTRNRRSTSTSLVSSTATFSLSSIEFRLVTNKTVESAEDFTDDDSYDSDAFAPEMSVDEGQNAILTFRSISSLMLPRAALEIVLPESSENTLKSKSLHPRRELQPQRLRNDWRLKWQSLISRTWGIACVRSTSLLLCVEMSLGQKHFVYKGDLWPLRQFQNIDVAC